MAIGVSSPQYTLRCGLRRFQGGAEEVRRFDINVPQIGYGAILFKSLRRYIPPANTWNKKHEFQRRLSIQATDGSKSGFGRQPVKKKKKANRPQPKNEEDQLARAQQILAQKQQVNDDATTAVSEQAPALDLEGTEEKEKAVVTNDDFEERLAVIRRKAKELKEAEEYRKFLPIDYDAPLPASEVAKWTDSIGARIGIGVAAVVFALIFTLGDFLPSGSPSGVSSNQQQVEQPTLPPEEAAKLKAQVEKFEETLKTSPDDRDALEGAGVTYAELGEYSKSATYLTKLVQKVPKDVEAQRLLGEVRYEAGDYAGSATAYRSAVRAAPKDTIGLLQGLVSALLADNKPSEAVGEMLAARTRLNAGPQSPPSSQEGSGNADDRVDPVQVEMLLGKAYSTWEGHTGDAIAVYDNLISSYPDDFRGYLAKGILLKDQGKDSDAERMFIQARYLAPPKAKGFVDRYSKR
ncbi:uncharacterized protein [Physcomitrium patens]|uniref:Uncharacterized protein n=1 Tax=Physcomitrium patens TaxID=3218 RepID=A0A2K1KKA6_PHYPA|nr:uncharacterized protein LOC112282900 [Physcomitrium patens]PNR54193.1 hypothetical protein PHYPA_007870 [Physcomitrium patens]|eukprot:XP_024376808.1 uncharacterized protein LOC112282900 [Physcomitrella patens]